MEDKIMRALSVALAIFVTIFFVRPAPAQTYGGFDCTVDCSGHAAGYKWADDHGINDEADCPEGNSQSFHEGCIAYTQDNARDPDSDDDGNTVGQPRRAHEDSDDDDDDDDK
jgi:hypothetical protein